MTTAPRTQTKAIALNAASGDVPEWIQLTPSGPDIEGRDGRAFTLTNPEAVIDAFRANEADLPVDFEHSTQVKGANGEPAPAIGWIKDMDVRDGAIWAKVDWTEAGREAIAAREYRYVSPVFHFIQTVGDIVEMVSAGLTNQPNLKMAALNSQGTEDPMDEEIRAALGLGIGATSAQAVSAITALKGERDTALNRAETPDPTKFVPRADYDLAMNKIKGFEEAGAEAFKTAVNSAVDAAVEAGKIAPASKDYHIAACSDQTALDAFNDMVAATPVIAGRSGLDGKPPNPGGAPDLDADTLAVCRQVGLTPEEFAAEQKKGG